MKKIVLFVLSIGWWLLTTTTTIQALNLDPLGEVTEASSPIEASEAGKLASSSAEVDQKIQEKKDQDITETGGKQKSKLAAYLDEHPIGPLSWHNPLQHAIRQAITNGLPANIIVLLMLFPLIASIIAFGRHIVGLKGFGVYIPAVLSVAFVSTGIVIGVLIFFAVLIAATLARKVVKRLKLPLLPRTAMLLWVVTFLVLILLIISSLVNISALLSISIFPLLIIMLLTENFMSTQLFNSQKEALSITFETLLVAILCALLINLESIQQFVLIYPELSLLAVAGLNMLIGKYTGLRLLERVRFESIIEEEE
ncbi:MAG: 7TM domain-containing protein [Patescibacteria group bacterium]